MFMPVLQVNSVFAGYRCLEFLGGGAYGEVYRVKEVGGDDTYSVEFALKLPRDSSIDRETLLKEARLWASRSQNSHIARLVKAGFEGGQFYMVSEYLAGGSLRKRIGMNPGRPQVSQLWAVEMVCGVLQAVVYLHTPQQIAGYDEPQSVLHRDLKPENILLDGDNPKVTDFGMSRAFRSSQGVMSSGGTFEYNAPETFGKGMTAACDVWSCAVILYELLSGQLPFQGDNQAAVMGSIITSPLPPLPTCVPVELRRIVERALQKDPTKRYGSAKELLEVLGATKLRLGAQLVTLPKCLKSPNACCLLQRPTATPQSIETPRKPVAPKPTPNKELKTPILPRPKEKSPIQVQGLDRRTVLIGGGAVIGVGAIATILMQGGNKTPENPQGGDNKNKGGTSPPQPADPKKLTTELTKMIQEEPIDYAKVVDLLKRGADPNVERRKDGTRKSLLIFAIQQKHKEVMDILLNAKVDPNKKDSFGATPLIYAALDGQAEMCRSLLGAGAKVNARSTGDGATALIYASMLGRSKVVKVLLDAGADTSMQDKKGNTAITLAKDDETRRALSR
jgi:serine/threonine protein kinase